MKYTFIIDDEITRLKAALQEIIHLSVEDPIVEKWSKDVRTLRAHINNLPKEDREKRLAHWVAQSKKSTKH